MLRRDVPPVQYPCLQFGVLSGREIAEQHLLGTIGCRIVEVEITFQNEVQFEHPAPALPAQLLGIDGGMSLAGRTQTAFFSIRALMCPIALVGLSPFGHTSTQFMMCGSGTVCNGPSSASRRSSVAWSRESARKRQAVSSACGP